MTKNWSFQSHSYAMILVTSGGMFSSPSSGVSLTKILLKLSKSFIFQSCFWWYSNQQLHWYGEYHFIADQRKQQANCASDYLKTSQVSHQTPLEKWMGLDLGMFGCFGPFFLGAFCSYSFRGVEYQQDSRRSNWLKSNHITSFQPYVKLSKGNK